MNNNIAWAVVITVSLSFLIVLLTPIGGVSDSVVSFEESVLNSDLSVEGSTVFIGDNFGHGVVAAVDPITSTLAIINVEHGELHAGRMFSIDGFNDIASNSNVTYLFVPPNSSSGKQAHLAWTIDFEVEGSMFVYENCSYSSVGTPINSFNRNRLFGDSQPLSKAYIGPVVTSLGDLLISKRIGSGRAYGGESRGMYELNIGLGVPYCFVITNHVTGSSNLFNYQVDWYEVDSFVPQ